MTFDLRPHQEAAIAKMHNGCILCGGVGVGKSHTAVGYYLQNEAPKPVYVITTAKKRDKADWQWLWGEIGMCSDDAITLGSVVIVDSWNNIDKYEEVSDAFFIFDEQRLVGTGRWVKAFYKIAAANNWIMLSATPGDNWLDYVPVFRANGFIRNITQFKEDHCVMRWTGRYYQLAGYRQVGKLVRWRNQLLVDMPYERHTVRHSHDVAVDYDRDLVREMVKRRWHVYENRPLTDASELFRVMRKVVYSDESRLKAVRELLKTHQRLIVFYNFDYELEMLRTLSIPPTQIMKTPDGIVPLGPSSTLTSSTSASTRSPTRSDTESRTRSTQTTRTGISKTGSDTESRTSAIPTSTSTSSDSWKTKSTTSRAMTVDQAIAQGSSPGGYWTVDEGNGELFIPMPSSNPWDYLLSPEGMRENALLSQSKRSESIWNSSGSPCDGQSRNLTSTQTHMSIESFRQHDCSQESQKEICECPSQLSPTSSTRVSTSYESLDDTLTTKTDTSRVTDSPRKSTSNPSSQQSRPSQDHSSDGSGSTPSPQFQVAEWNGHRHEAVPTTTSWVYLVQYAAGAEAWECTDTDAMVFFSMPYSWKKWDQAHGRIDRMNTPFKDLYYYTLVSKSPIDRAVSRSLKAQKSFNESAFIGKMGWK